MQLRIGVLIGTTNPMMFPFESIQDDLAERQGRLRRARADEDGQVRDPGGGTKVGRRS